MKLDFEIWLGDQRQTIPAAAKGIFDEAVICYKASAYRGAYILSYLGFLTIIRERLLVSGPPSSEIMPDQTKWRDIQAALRKPEKWDYKVNHLIAHPNEKSDSKDKKKDEEDKNIFLISKSVKSDAIHFKEKRNDCVHGKDIVSYPHVECLWMFIQNHSGKFMVNGGIDGFVELVKSHFDPAENDPTADFTELLSLLPSVVHSDDYKELFERLFEAVPMKFQSRDYYKKFWIALLEESDETVRSHLLNYIKEDTYILDGFVFAYPKLIRFYNDDEPALRKIWNNSIIPPNSLFEEKVDSLYEITNWLITNKKIPKAELQDFWMKWISKKTLLWVRDVLPFEFICLLRSSGYFDSYRNYVNKENNGSSSYPFWHDQEQMLPFYLKYAELDKDFVRHINDLLSNLYTSYSFKARIQEILESDDCERLRSFQKHCVELEIKCYYGDK